MVLLRSWLVDSSCRSAPTPTRPAHVILLSSPSGLVSLPNCKRFTPPPSRSLPPQLAAPAPASPTAHRLNHLFLLVLPTQNQGERRRRPRVCRSFLYRVPAYRLDLFHGPPQAEAEAIRQAVRASGLLRHLFCVGGHVPSLKEGNSQETIFSPPWRHEPVADERYMVTYNPTKDKVYALLKDQAKSDDILKAAFHAHVLLHFINASHVRKQMNSNGSDHYGNLYPRNMDLLAQRHAILLGTASCS